MFSSSLPPVVCGRADVLFTLFTVCLPAAVSMTCCVASMFLSCDVVCPVLPVSLDWPF